MSKFVARYRAEGEASFEPRSRRPHTSPTAIPAATVDLILELRDKLAPAGLDAGTPSPGTRPSTTTPSRPWPPSAGT